MVMASYLCNRTKRGSASQPYDLYVLGDDARIGRALSESDEKVATAKRVLRAPGVSTETKVAVVRAIFAGQ